MADIEEAEGHQGAVREWLGRAARAPRDKAWVADGVISDRWAPVSPSGALDAFVWRTPDERFAAPEPSPTVAEPAAAPVAETIAPPPPAQRRCSRRRRRPSSLSEASQRLKVRPRLRSRGRASSSIPPRWPPTTPARKSRKRNGVVSGFTPMNDLGPVRPNERRMESINRKACRMSRLERASRALAQNRSNVI